MVGFSNNGSFKAEQEKYGYYSLHYTSLPLEYVFVVDGRYYLLAGKDMFVQ